MFTVEQNKERLKYYFDKLKSLKPEVDFYYSGSTGQHTFVVPDEQMSFSEFDAMFDSILDDIEYDYDEIRDSSFLCLLNMHAETIKALEYPLVSYELIENLEIHIPKLTTLEKMKGKHFKSPRGDVYKVLTVSRDVVTHEEWVIFGDTEVGEIYARPLDVFIERFESIDDSLTPKE